MKKLNDVYTLLLKEYGKQNWWPASSEVEMIVGAILVQNTNWRNVEKALLNFNDSLSFNLLAQLSHDELEQLIKPSGFFVRKAKTIKEFVCWYKQYDFNLTLIDKIAIEELRSQLLNIKGIGPETADCILLYNFNRPVFVVDAYLKRMFIQLGLPTFKKYDDYQKYMMDNLSNDLYLFNEYHALIVQYGKDFTTNKKMDKINPLNIYIHSKR